MLHAYILSTWEADTGVLWVQGQSGLYSEFETRLDYGLGRTLSYTSEISLEIQSNLHQNSNLILHINRKINSKIHMEAQKTLKLTISTSNNITEK
jgi:hypothetical protein